MLFVCFRCVLFGVCSLLFVVRCVLPAARWLVFAVCGCICCQLRGICCCVVADCLLPVCCLFGV